MPKPLIDFGCMIRLSSIVLLVVFVCACSQVRAQDSTQISGYPWPDPNYNPSQIVISVPDDWDRTPKADHTYFGVRKDDFSKFGLELSDADDSSKSRGYFYRKLRKEHFIKIDTTDFILMIDPSLNFEGWVDLEESSPKPSYVNTRGLTVSGKIGEKLIFETSFYENQAFLPSYLDSFVSRFGVVPGQGRVKEFKESGYDYSMASGMVAFQAAKWLNIQLGNGKNFVGDGYRSLALSRNAFNYPFIKLTSWFGRFQYTNLFMGLQNLNVVLPTSTATEPRFQRKIGTFHHLDWAVNKRLTIGVFEQIIWGKSKSSGKIELNSEVLSFVNPLPFIRPLQYGFAGSNNVLIGLNWNVALPKETDIYGQFVLDDTKGGKNGFQIGAKTRGIRGLYLGLEFNQVAPYTYGHTDSTRNFAHYNQPLAHPLGAGFSEVSGRVSYLINGFFLKMRASYATYDDDENVFHWGKDIFLSDNSKSNVFIEPTKATLQYQSAQIGYILNYTTGMQISLGFINRIEKAVGGGEMQYAFLSFSTKIPERIYDF